MGCNGNSRHGWMQMDTDENSQSPTTATAYGHNGLATDGTKGTRAATDDAVGWLAKGARPDSPRGASRYGVGGFRAGDYCLLKI